MKIKKLVQFFAASAFSTAAFLSMGSPVQAKSGVSLRDFSVSESFQFKEGDSGVLSVLEEAALPDKLDLRTRGVVTPVKFQNPFGACWSFATIAASETSILSEMGTTYEETGLDLSEHHLAWFTYQYLNDPYSSQNGEGYHFNRQISSGEYLDQGGFAFFAGGLFSQGAGPVLEEDCPYQGKNGWVRRLLDDDDSLMDYCYSDRDDWSVDNSERFQKAFSLKEEYILNTKLDSDGNYVYDERITNAVKKQLNLGRGVAVSYCADQSQPDEEGNQDYLNKENWCQYTDVYTPLNHEVCIIGYDDNYSKDNFNEEHQPEYDGAYLVKNSWGSGENEFPNRGKGNWGIEENGVHTGYFWLSYYDMSISQFEIFDYDLSKSGKETEIVDQYDYAGTNNANTLETNKDCHMANYFTAQYNQELREVSCVTGSTNESVSYEVYLINDDSSQTLAATAHNKYEYTGYHKETLSKPVKLSKGQKYSIVVTETNEKGHDEIILGYQNENESTSISQNDNGYVKTIVNEGESYLKYDGEWYDWSELRHTFNLYSTYGYDPDNFCIKGYSVLLDSTNLSDFTVKLSKTSYDYNGQEKKPEVTIDGLTYGKDYSVSYSNNVNAGTACVTVTGVGIFSGSTTSHFSILKKDTDTTEKKETATTEKKSETAPVLKTPVWKKITSRKTSLIIHWKKAANATGYQIRYSKKKNMKNSKTITVKSAKTVSKRVKGLHSKRYYYVRIRSCRKANGKTSYSAWSTIKKVKTK